MLGQEIVHSKLFPAVPPGLTYQIRPLIVCKYMRYRYLVLNGVSSPAYIQNAYTGIVPHRSACPRESIPSWKTYCLPPAAALWDVCHIMYLLSFNGLKQY